MFHVGDAGSQPVGSNYDPIIINLQYAPAFLTVAATVRIGPECGSIYPPPPPPVCLVDFNHDGGVDGADIEAFFIAWANGDPSADINHDGAVTGADVEAFFALWELGC